MSPILVRPVREQLEHDRVIRLLQAKYKRKFEVGINPGNEQAVPVGAPPTPWYPDLVLQSPERGRKLLGVVEVETAESVNSLEAMSEWVPFSRLRAPFHLYVPAVSVDVARRLCADLQVAAAEIWAYTGFGDQIRFTLVQRAPQPAEARSSAAAAASPTRRVPVPAARSRPARPPAARSTRRPAPTASAGGRRKVAAKKTQPARGAATRKNATRKKTAGPVRAQKRK